MTTSARLRPAFLLLSLLMSLLPALALAAPPPASVMLEELSWTELRDRIAGGARTVLVPLGGTEQSGPHLALGKHNLRVRWLAERIAQRLGDAVVAPVLAYVPEGRISPPASHMRWPGTLSIPEPAFEAVLAATVRSLRAHGLCDVFFLGDHGGYSASLERVAQALNREAASGANCRVHALPEYYRAATDGFGAVLHARGYSADEVGTHAGLADTALTLATAPALVRMDVAQARPRGAQGDGVSGDPRRASAELGRLGTDLIVEQSVAAIRQQRLGTRTSGKP
jgi:creatinine amidohydrolase/Fe(II)-dependent formamide hydrolase-like protein